jgi:hypothetical protein
LILDRPVEDQQRPSIGVLMWLPIGERGEALISTGPAMDRTFVPTPG